MVSWLYSLKDEVIDFISSVRFGFCKGGCSSYVVQQCINSLAHYWSGKITSPSPSPSPSPPVGERGKSGTGLMPKPGDITYSFSTRFGGRGLG